MSELPKDWNTSTISEVADINVRPKKDELDDEMLASFVPMKCVETENGRFESPEDKRVGDVKKGYTPMRDGDVIFAKVTPCMENGKAAVVRGLTNGIGFGSTEFYSLRPKSHLSSDFLFYYMIQQGFRREAERHMTGAVGLRRMPKNFLEQHLIPLPPLPEQRRIVARIEELFSRLDAGVAALRQAKAQLKRYRQSVLAAAVTGELTRAWREQHPDVEPAEKLLERILEERRVNWTGRRKYKEPVSCDISDLKKLPQTWSWSAFDGVLTELRNGISKKPDATAGLRILRISAVRPMAVDLDDSRFLSDSLSKCSIYKLNRSDLLITRYNGTRAFVGVCGLVRDLPEPFVYPDKLIRARLVDEKTLIPSFVEIAMNAGESRRFLEKRIRTTAGQSGISGGDIKVTPLPIPPTAEQRLIVAEVDARTTAINHLEAELDRQISRSHRLRQSTLADAFTRKF